MRGEDGELILKNGKKQPDAWIDEKKSKVGYEIPFTRYFYKYEAPQPSAEIMAEILGLEKELEGSLQEVFDI